MKLKSTVNVTSQEFKENYSAMLKMVQALQEKLDSPNNPQSALYQGEKKHLDRHLARGQLLARDRIELVLDEDSPFLELMPLAGYGQKGITAGAGFVAGIGLICGVECMITANVPTISGGAINESTVLKTRRIAEIVLENNLPSVDLIQSGGANLMQQAKVFHVGGGMFRNLAIRSKRGIPSISVVFGSSTAGGAYIPGMSDYVIMVKNQAQVFLGGPPLVKMATGEETDAETLGGAEMHCRISGVSDYLALSEYDAINKAREIVSTYHWRKKGEIPSSHYKVAEEPNYNPDELLGIVSANIRIPFEIREVIARIVDGSRFSEFKPLYGRNLVTGWSTIYGFPVGIIANNNVLFHQEANKGTQFIHLCNQKHTPILFFQNITGFMVGRNSEESGIIKAGSRLINAVSNSGVPAITIVMGASYGAGNYAMNGRAYCPRFLFSWPNSRCSVMGSEQLTGVMDMVMRESAARSGKQIDEEIAEGKKQILRNMVEQQSDVYYTSSRLLDDGIIDPRDTRIVLGFTLSIVYGNEVAGGNIGGVSRM